MMTIIYYQIELMEKVDKEQQLRKEFLISGLDNDVKHGDVNTEKETCQEHDNPKLRNEYKALTEQGQEYFFILIGNFKSIFHFPEEKLQISQDHVILH